MRKIEKPTNSKDFSQASQEWEVSVFLEASHFTVVHHLGRKDGGPPNWERQEFKRSELPQAIEAAAQPTANSKPRLLYAVTAEGRQIVLDRVDQPKWLALWKEKVQ